MALIFVLRASLCYDSRIRKWIRTCKGEEDYDTKRNEKHDPPGKSHYLTPVRAWKLSMRYQVKTNYPFACYATIIQNTSDRLSELCGDGGNE